MVQIDYRINQNLPDTVKAEIASQPNLINVESNNTYVLFSFDHTPSQSTAFKKYLLTKLNLDNENLSKYTNFNGASTIYTTDTPAVLTNIGTAFKNVYVRSDGMSFGADTDVYDTVKIIVHWTRGASDTGVHSLQVVDKSTPANVLASLSPLVSGVNVGANLSIPAALLESQKLYLVQVKSTVATDDPTFEGIRVMMR